MGGGSIPCPSAFGDHSPESPWPAQLEIPCQPLHGAWLLQIAGICITEHWREQTVLEALSEDNCGLKGLGWMTTSRPFPARGENISVIEKGHLEAGGW